MIGQPHWFGQAGRRSEWCTGPIRSAPEWSSARPSATKQSRLHHVARMAESHDQRVRGHPRRLSHNRELDSNRSW